MFKFFAITKSIPIMASIGSNVEQVAQGVQNEIDGVIFWIALVVCSVGIVVGYFKRNVGLTLVAGTIALYTLYYLLTPILEFVKSVTGG